MFTRFAQKILPDRFSNKGFTLVEVSVAICIIIVGISGLFGLINQTFSYTSANDQNLEAAYLGKDGIEIVKNIRDSNFLNVHYSPDGSASWNDGLVDMFNGCLNHCVDCTNGSGGCEADYTSSFLTPFAGGHYLLWGDKFNNSPAVNFWNYTVGRAGPFKRKITVTPVPGPDPELNIKVEVMWSERGRPHNLIVQENLYQWWP
jgi:hypothetical protein